MGPWLSSQLFFKAKPSSPQGRDLDASYTVSVFCPLGLCWPWILVTTVTTKLDCTTREQFGDVVCSKAASSPQQLVLGDCPSTAQDSEYAAVQIKTYLDIFTFSLFFPNEL